MTFYVNWRPSRNKRERKKTNRMIILTMVYSENKIVVVAKTLFISFAYVDTVVQLSLLDYNERMKYR